MKRRCYNIVHRINGYRIQITMDDSLIHALSSFNFSRLKYSSTPHESRCQPSTRRIVIKFVWMHTKRWKERDVTRWGRSSGEVETFFLQVEFEHLQGFHE